ncbi:hypothetical protein [Microbacterium sp. Clip185]|uniref:hypothetical protein n=1 Tax=Microbacterium sp. Clip185 TaxID=3025663 RepID=UPI0023670C87|nr:hypothetical protein [Microbacterium sp. Clip185]WDG17493.1 hypothetical protein PQV94_12805 [Microbacterium sp. Clip185]
MTDEQRASHQPQEVVVPSGAAPKHRRWACLIGIPLLVLLLGGFAYVLPTCSPTFIGVAKVAVAVLGVLTAIGLAYADSEPISRGEESAAQRALWCRDRVKLLTHGALIAIALFVTGVTWIENFQPDVCGI